MVKWPLDHGLAKARARRAIGSKAPWHKGRMVTRGRAMTVAARLFPDDVADGSDCRAEVGREGKPCRACAEKNRRWLERIAQTRLAMLKAF